MLKMLLNRPVKKTSIALLLSVVPSCGFSWVTAQGAPETEPRTKLVDKQLDERIARLIETIDVVEVVEPSFKGHTPAVAELVKIGKPALEPLLNVMGSGTTKESLDMLTGEPYERELSAASKRFCAHVAAGWIAHNAYAGKQNELGEPEDLDMLFKWQEAVKSFGRYDDRGSLEERRAVVKKWREWVRSHQ